MRPVSDAFLRILRGSHVPIFRATLCKSFQTGVSPTGTQLPIVDGDVTIDASADIRSTLDLSTSPDQWDQVTPYGDEIFVERGVLGGGGQRMWVGLGYYRVESVEQEDVPDGEVRIMGADRMAGLIEARLEAPVQFGSAVTVDVVFDQLVRDVYPAATIEYDFPAEATLLAGSHIVDEDRFEFLDDLVTALAKTWYWDHRGVLVVQDLPSPSAPVWQVTHGADGVLVELNRERSRGGVYNIVVAKGESDVGVPVRAVARDTNPASPTYYLGTFGRVVRFFTSPLLTTQVGVANAAQKILSRAIGLPNIINFGAVPNPALEAGDAVYVTYSDSARAEVHVIDRLRIPLSVDGAMTASTKDKTNEDIEVGV